jgi:hypothetical protein
MEKETRKELIKKFREQVAGGKYASRETLLAYAWLRDVPYVVKSSLLMGNGVRLQYDQRNPNPSHREHLRV